MFEIRIDGHVADLNPNATMQINLNSPIFNQDEFLAPYSAILPDLPNTPTNRRLINHFNFLQSTTLDTRKRVDNYLNGHLLGSGNMILQEASEEGFKSGVTENLGEFFGEYQSQLLSDIDFGSVTIPASVPSYVAVLGIPALYFPKILNPNFYSGQHGAYIGTMNNFVPGTVVASSPLVPSVSLYFLLRKITEITGVTITGPALYNPDFQALVLPSIREVSTGALPIASILPEIKLSEFFIELRKILNLNFSFSGITRTLTISFLQISNSEITNWQSIASASEKKIAEQNSRLSIAFTPDPGDALFKDTPPQIQIAISESPNIPAGGITPIVSKFSSILKDTATGLGKIDQPGISNINGQQDKKQGLRIAYIHAASTTYTAHFESPSGLLNLTPSALLAGPYSQLANIRANAFYLKKKMMLTEAHIAAINFSTPIFFNGLLWLLLSASPTFPITEPTECLFVKI